MMLVTKRLELIYINRNNVVNHTTVILLNYIDEQVFKPLLQCIAHFSLHPKQ